MVVIDENKLLQGEICFLGAISQLFRNYEKELPEEVVYGLGFGLGFRCKKEWDTSIDINCVDLISDYDTYRSFFYDIDCDVDVKMYDDFFMFKQYIDGKSGESFLVTVDTYYLPYSNTYGISHDAHVVVLSKIEDKEYVVQDCYVSAVVPGKIITQLSEAELEKCCNIANRGNEKKYLLWSFAVGDYLGRIEKSYVKERITYLDELVLHVETNEYVHGEKGLDELLLKFKTFEKNNFGSSDVLLQINRKISANGGLYQTRKLYGRFVNWLFHNQIIDNNKKQIASEVSNRFIEISNNWKIISTIILKAAVLKRVPNWDNIIRRCERNIKDEKEAYHMLIDLINTNKEEMCKNITSGKYPTH